MNKNEFGLLVDNLVNKAKRVGAYNYSGAMEVMYEFQNFTMNYQEYLNQYVLEHFSEIESDFERSRQYSKPSLKRQNWDNGMTGLLRDIESMKRENKFPEE